MISGKHYYTLTELEMLYQAHHYGMTYANDDELSQFLEDLYLTGALGYDELGYYVAITNRERTSYDY